MALLREALATAWAQPVASVISIVIIAGMVCSVLLTTGRTVGSEQAVLESIDTAGTRSIVVRAEPDAGLDTSVIDRLRDVQGINWLGAFGQAVDVTNVAIDGGSRVGARSMWTLGTLDVGVPNRVALPNDSAWASSRALRSLGIAGSSGGVVGANGEDYAVVGRFVTPDFLTFLEPLVVVPHAAATNDLDQPISVLVVVAERPDLVGPLAQVVASLLGADDSSKVSIVTSERLATLRALVEGQLGTYGRSLILLIFGVSAILVAAILYGLVTLRRKDFGRRRALGASQSLIVWLLLLQIGSLSIVSSILGTIIAVIVLESSGDPLPSIEFLIALNVLSVAVAVVAAMIPAISAARREPIAELRVP